MNEIKSRLFVKINTFDKLGRLMVRGREREKCILTISGITGVMSLQILQTLKGLFLINNFMPINATT